MEALAPGKGDDAVTALDLKAVESTGLSKDIAELLEAAHPLSIGPQQ